MKGIATLLEAFAKLRTERDVELLLVTKPTPGGRTEQLIDELGIGEHVSFVSGISDAELVEVMGSAEVACVPSLYEGFSLPTAELMACETPLVVSRAGAIPEVVGADGECADLVTPGDVGELELAHRRRCSTTPSAGRGWARPGARRVLEQFSWHAVAEATAAAYERRDRRQLDHDGTRRRRPPVLTVDFDRLGLQPGDRVIDMGCGAGRHAFEMYRRGADVIAFDQDADELAGVLELFGAMKEAGEVPDGRRGRHQGGRRAVAAVRRRRVRPGGRLRGARAHPRRHPGDRRAGPGAAPRRHDGGHGAALAAGDGLLEALRRLPQRRRAATSGSTPTTSWSASSSQRRAWSFEGKDHAHGAALAVLVAQVRRRRRQRPATRS